MATVEHLPDHRLAEIEQAVEAGNLIANPVQVGRLSGTGSMAIWTLVTAAPVEAVMLGDFWRRIGLRLGDRIFVSAGVETIEPTHLTLVCVADAAVDRVPEIKVA